MNLLIDLKGLLFGCELIRFNEPYCKPSKTSLGNQQCSAGFDKDLE
jgi:hypothetical protein